MRQARREASKIALQEERPVLVALTIPVVPMTYGLRRLLRVKLLQQDLVAMTHYLQELAIAIVYYTRVDHCPKLHPPTMVSALKMTSMGTADCL
mmetsp:Transcript_92701/g.161082  ORF Transcript_92701/g.161082 Transcript_92701/m.161082 type:complete len:94 (-) Transcript_92701:531-812(-)